MNWKDEPYIEYIHEEDKEKRYKKSSEHGFVDADNDFLIGESGGFLLNIGEWQFTNIELLREAARTYEAEGVYIKEKPGSLAYERFREREEYRRKYGITMPCKLTKRGTKNLHITGSLYNFINYGQILKLDTKSVNKDSKAASKIYGIPEFFAYQYWYTKQMEFARNNNMHIISLKPRRSGFTYLESIENANIVNLIPKVTVLHAAYDKKYLTQSGGISTLSKTQLDYYETDTPFTRGYLSEDIEDLELGYKPAGTNIRKGYRGKLITVSFGKNAMAAAGKDAIKISVEELSNAANLKDFLDLTLPTTRTGDYTTGLLHGWGTGGAEEAHWEHFEEVFYNPSNYGMMPFENVWEGEARHTVCGAFKPYLESLQAIDINPESNTYGQSAMDENGNSRYDVAFNIIQHSREKARKTKKTKEYLKDIGQFCVRPSEAFTNTSDNMFTSPEFTEHVKQVMNNPDYHTYWDGNIIEDNGRVKFMSNEELRASGYSDRVHPFIEEVPFKKKGDIYGCIRMYQPPLKGINSKSIPDNLYRVWHDPFGVEKNQDQVTNQNSLADIIVYMRPNNETEDIGNKIVAHYRGRPGTHLETNTILYRIARLYNAKIQFENDRGQVQSDFKNHFKALHMLEREPNAAWDASLAAKQKQGFGMTLGAGTSNRALRALDYLYDWLYEIRSVNEDGVPFRNFHTIKDIVILMELMKFTPRLNLDAISTLKIGMFDMKEVETRKIKSRHTNNNVRKNAFSRQWFQ